jgi:hypothetical protein
LARPSNNLLTKISLKFWCFSVLVQILQHKDQELVTVREEFAMSFEVDSWVWMADEEEEYLPAQVAKSSFKPGEDGIVKTEDGEVSVNWPSTSCIPTRAVH